MISLCPSGRKFLCLGGGNVVEEVFGSIELIELKCGGFSCAAEGYWVISHSDL